jgi:hypothetical protein
MAASASAASAASWRKALRGALGFVRGVSCFYVVYNYGGFLSKAGARMCSSRLALHFCDLN